MRSRDWIPVLALAVLCVAMLFVPSAATVVHDSGNSVRARVLSTDESDLTLTGLLEYGTQHLEVEVLEGPGKGQRFNAQNELRAQLDLDKKFRVGDYVSVTWPAEGANPGDSLVARDHWRLGWAGVLFGLFAVFLVAFGGFTGLKALFSFAFSCCVVWKLLVPLCLRGWHAAFTTFAVVTVLTGVIMFLIAGPTRKGVVAFLGAIAGVASSLALAAFFTQALHVTGATMPFVQALLHSGYDHLDLASIFSGAVILASSGAVMDLAMDIAAGVGEVAHHRPDLPRRALFLSGVRMGRAVVGTMTTTLLLAYSGGYLTLLMVFAAQGTAPLVFLNATIVSAELVKTLVGSFGLVLVAPLTASIAACAYWQKANPQANEILNPQAKDL